MDTPEDDAQTVRRIALTADGGCSSCTFELMRKLPAAFPEHLAVWLQEYEFEEDREILREDAASGSNVP